MSKAAQILSQLYKKLSGSNNQKGTDVETFMKEFGVGDHDLTKVPDFSISKICLPSGQDINLRADDKVIIVGANNSGKSQLLREIYNFIEQGERGTNLILEKLEVDKHGSAKHLHDFLDKNANLVEGYYHFKDWRISKDGIDLYDYSSQEQGYLRGNLIKGFVRNISATERLSICELKETKAMTEVAKNPQQILYDDQALMSRISRLFHSAFDADLMFDFRAGLSIPIYVGEIPDEDKYPNQVSDDYVNQVRKNPKLHEQGDGVKSFAGMLFETIVFDTPVTMIDEPEAFLHPPQMRRLGKILSSEVKGQLLVATHSSDILRGFLEQTSGHLKILRISRDRNASEIYEAEPTVVKQLWEVPVLKYSNALESIFHEQAIICESDSDCRLINAMADEVEKGGQYMPDTAYIPASGKDAIPHIATVLRRVGVPVKAIFDFDFIFQESLVKSAVEAFGGNWQQFEKDYHQIHSGISTKFRKKNVEDIKTAIVSALNDAPKEQLPKKLILKELKGVKQFQPLKESGKSALPPGPVYNAFERFDAKLRDIGIYIIHCGEIEGFCRTQDGHGPKFVTNVLNNMNLAAKELDALREFVKRVHLDKSGEYIIGS